MTTEIHARQKGARISVARLRSIDGHRCAHVAFRVRETICLWRVELDELDARFHGFLPCRLFDVQIFRHGRLCRWFSDVRSACEAVPALRVHLSVHRTVPWPWLLIALPAEAHLFGDHNRINFRLDWRCARAFERPRYRVRLHGDGIARSAFNRGARRGPGHGPDGRNNVVEHNLATRK